MPSAAVSNPPVAARMLTVMSCDRSAPLLILSCAFLGTYVLMALLFFLAAPRDDFTEIRVAAAAIPLLMSAIVLGMYGFLYRDNKSKSEELQAALIDSAVEFAVSFSDPNYQLLQRREGRKNFFTLLVIALNVGIIVWNVMLLVQAGGPPRNTLPVFPTGISAIFGMQLAFPLFALGFCQPVCRENQLLSCTTSGLLWEMIGGRVFIPWSIISRSEVRSGRLSPHVVLTLNKDHKPENTEYFTVALGHVTEEQIVQLQACLMAHRPMGYQEMTTQPAVVGVP